MRTQTSCLDDETLAALIDGRLKGSARQAVVEHLAACEQCYEVMAEALHLRQALADEEGLEDRPRLALVPDPGGPERAVLEEPVPQASEASASPEESAPGRPEEDPLPASNREPEDPKPEARSGEPATISPRGWGSLAAAFAVAGLGIALLWPLVRPRSLAEEVPAAALPATWAQHDWSALTRSPAGPEAKARAFRAGVHHFDLEVALANEDRASALAALHALRDLPDAFIPYYHYEPAAAALGAGARPGSVRRQVRDGRAQLLLELEEKSLGPFFKWGTWVETGRLAALGGGVELLRSQGFREDAEALLGIEVEELVKEQVLAVLAAAGSDLDAEALACLRDSFDTILERSGRPPFRHTGG